jgi:predicted metal-dependent hydrolase
MASPTSRPEFALGMKRHNEGEYYEAHEAWEELWLAESDDARRLFLQGLIQVTSAFHKVFFQRELGGAGRLLARGLSKLEPIPDDFEGVALGPFRDGAKRCAEAMAKLPPTKEGAALFEATLVPKLSWTEPR